MKVVVLGSGLVGAPMAKDLAKNGEFEVTSVDIDPGALEALKSEPSIRTVLTDLSTANSVRDVVREADFVINAVPGQMGFAVLTSVIETNKSVVDIAFFPENPFLLDQLARAKGVGAVVDCGVAPGMSNILVARAESRLDALDSVRIARWVPPGRPGPPGTRPSGRR